MILSKIPLAQTVIKLCELKEIKHIVISPGSRNAPLTIGFTNHPYFKCYSIVDERCAAFFALGIAQQLNEAVVLVCTSGSALLNYYPAVSEAYYSEIPLVILSADRPEYLVGIGDGQTIDQKKVYGNHVLLSANLKEDIDAKGNPQKKEAKIIQGLENKFERFIGLQKNIQEKNAEIINNALNTAVVKSGPVHLNMPFNEPLYETTDQFIVEQFSAELNKSKIQIDDDLLDDFAAQWNAATKKMILVGVSTPNKIDRQWIEALAKDDSILVFTETTSNLHHPDFFPSIDKIIAPLTQTEFEALQPEILLTMGGMIISKKVKAFLRRHQPKQHWHLGENRANDTFFCLSHHLNYPPNDFFAKFMSKVKSKQSRYKALWQVVKQRRHSKHQNYLASVPFSDLIVFNLLLNALPENSILQMGNSSAIRYTQLFDLDPSVEVFCNRGTSGIDGSTSTAIGAAAVTSKQTTLITGDLSFFYDSNGLWNAYTPNDFRIIIINNGGGGIFRILPGHKNSENFDTYFETTHNLDASHLSKMYNFEYSKIDNAAGLTKSLNGFFKPSSKPKILEIFTPRTLNDEILLDYFNYIK